MAPQTPRPVSPRISQSPTKPRPAQAKVFDVADLYREPLPVNAPGGAAEPADKPLDEKLRQAYFWIVNQAVISPHYDLEYHREPPATFRLGDQKTPMVLPTDQSYSSFILLPLLTFAVRRKCLFIGGPGRGKTASALLMGILAGYPVKEVRRGMQHGHPQMTVADLLGNPLPSDLVNAKSVADIRIAWRAWLDMRVKIIDEYNRIPTRTQSALLTVMGDNYAELLDHVHECPEAAWYLTANDDQGGGTYQVIEALRDRIDVTVQALAFNPRFLDVLLDRIESGSRPEHEVPHEIIFTPDECDRLADEIRGIPVPVVVRRRLEFFSSQLEYMEAAATRLEYQTKDTARLAGVDWGQVTGADTGRDKLRDPGAQTKNGLSVRIFMTLLHYAKAMAYFRGQNEVSLEDLRQVLPFVLHGKLSPDLDAPTFEASETAPFKTDRIGWLRGLFDQACQEYDRLDRDREDPVAELLAQLRLGLEGLAEGEVRARLTRIERTMAEITQSKKMMGHLADDLLSLKYLHQRYTNYLIWLTKQ